MKPYSLFLYDRATETTQRFQSSLTNIARGWKRSIRSNGGFYQGSFTLDGTPAELQDFFETKLGYEIRERTAGIKSWEGLVWEMDYTVNGVTRRRTLDLLQNKVRTTYATTDYSGDNFVKNPGFEDYTVVAGVVDDFFSWYEPTPGTGGSIKRDAACHGGTSSAKLDGDSDQEQDYDKINVTLVSNTWIRQNLQVTPGTRYKLTFWTKGDGTASPRIGDYGRWGLNDPNKGAFFRGPEETHIIGDWEDVICEFEGPSDGEVQLFFIAPVRDDHYAYFDDIELLENAQCVKETTWVQNIDSINRYGQEEEHITLDGYPKDTSEAYALTYLAENAWPWPRPVNTDPVGETKLEVTVVGYIWTAQNMYVQAGDGGEGTIDEYIKEIVGSIEGRSYRHGGSDQGAGDCEFLSYEAVDANALVVPQLTGVYERPWDVIQELTALGDASGNQWHAWVDIGRKFHYRPINVNPRYYLRKDGIFDTMAGRSPINPWLMRPAVIRDMTYRSSLADTGSFLLTQQDFYAEEIEMGDGWAFPNIKTSLFSDAELLLKQGDRGRYG